MQFFIGILPPEKIYNDINHLQKLFFKGIVEPHITIKAQGGLTEDKIWVEKVKRVAKNTRPFKVSLSDIKFFGDNVLYISVVSKEICNVHNKLVDIIAPSDLLIEQYFEGQFYIPHLTIAENTNKLSNDDLCKLKDLSRKILLDNEKEFTVDRFRIYHQENKGEHYRVLRDLTLENLTPLLL